MPFISLHLFALALTAIVILYSDHQAFDYFRGKKQLLSKKFVTVSHYLVWAGLLAMITTGVIMALPMWEYLLTLPQFYIKMGFVATLIVNALFIGKVSHVATVRPFAELSKKEQRVLLVSGAVSTICWIGAAVIGYFFL